MFFDVNRSNSRCRSSKTRFGKILRQNLFQFKLLGRAGKGLPFIKGIAQCIIFAGTLSIMDV